jgi:Glycosyltransferase family 87
LSAIRETHSGLVTPVTDRGGRPASSILVWIGLAILAAVGVWLLIAAWQEGLSGGRDFVQDYAAVIKIGQGRNPYEPYNDVTQELFGGPPHRGPLYSFHAPSSLPLVIWLLPFAKLWGYAGAFLTWGVVSLLALWSICWLTMRAIGPPRPALAGLLAALALIILPAIRESFEEGQLNVVVAAGMVGCWSARRSGRSGLAGVLLGGAFALKPIPGLFFLYYAWRRDWRLLGAAMATVALLAVIGVGLSGLDGARLWATVNYPSHADVWPGYPDNASVRGFFTRIFGPSDWRPRPRFPLPYAAALLWAASGALLTLAAIVAARAGTRRPPDAGPTTAFAAALWGLTTAPRISRDDPRGDLEVAVLTILTLLVTPIVWPHYYVVLVMPIAVITTYLGRLVLDGWVRSGSQPVADSIPDDDLVDPGVEAAGPPPPFDRRWRVLPTVSLAVVVVSTAILAGAQYVEPFREVGGQQLLALLALYAASLVALAWSAASHGRGASPAAVRYSAI